MWAKEAESLAQVESTAKAPTKPGKREGLILPPLLSSSNIYCMDEFYVIINLKRLTLAHSLSFS